MSDVCIITAFPTSTNIFCDFTKHEKMYIGNKHC